MIVGQQIINVHTQVGVGWTTFPVTVTYFRKGGVIEILEGWINPTIEKQMDWVQRMIVSANARRILYTKVLNHLYNNPDRERQWEGVVHG